LRDERATYDGVPLLKEILSRNLALLCAMKT